MKRKILLAVSILIVCLFLIYITDIVVQNHYQKNIVADSTPDKPIFSVDKLYFYSNANAVNQNESKASWDLNVSQYTDIAIFLKIHDVNNELTQALMETVNFSDNSFQVVEKTPQNTVTQLWLDNISFSNHQTGNLSLTYQNVQYFGKWDGSEPEKVSSISYEVVKNVENSSTAQIDEFLTLPITLRYENTNLRVNYLLTDIEEPLVFDGSLLKRCRVPLSSIENTVSCQLHIVNSLGEEYIANLHFAIPLQNENTGETIYHGSYTETLENMSINFLKK